MTHQFTFIHSEQTHTHHLTGFHIKEKLEEKKKKKKFCYWGAKSSFFFCIKMAATLSTSVSAPAEFYFDEKWKLSKKEGSSKSCRSSSSLMKNSSQRRCSFTRKCARLVKEQRARFYIMRRCITMLICWRDYSDSWRESGGKVKENLQRVNGKKVEGGKRFPLFFGYRIISCFLLRDLFWVCLGRKYKRKSTNPGRIFFFLGIQTGRRKGKAGGGKGTSIYIRVHKYLISLFYFSLPFFFFFCLDRLFSLVLILRKL